MGGGCVRSENKTHNERTTVTSYVVQRPFISYLKVRCVFVNTLETDVFVLHVGSLQVLQLVLYLI